MIMGQPDLTEPVETAARSIYDAVRPLRIPDPDGQINHPDWETLPQIYRHNLRKEALVWIAPAAQLIYDQGRRDERLEWENNGHGPDCDWWGGSDA